MQFISLNDRELSVALKTMAFVSKKLEAGNSFLRPEPFTQKGSYDDEVTLDFGYNKQLYVSGNFLCLASPVFEAMLRNESKLVQMSGKSYEDFLDFLMCIHPRILKEVDELNVLRIVLLAEKYQVTSIVTKCKSVMKSMLSNAEKKASKDGISVTQLVPLKECFNTLHSAISLNYTDIMDLAIKSIARFGYCLYEEYDHSQDVLNSYPGLIGRSDDNKYSYREIYQDCDVLFKRLSLDIRYKILSERLIRVNDNKFK